MSVYIPYHNGDGHTSSDPFISRKKSSRVNLRPYKDRVGWKHNGTEPPVLVIKSPFELGTWLEVNEYVVQVDAFESGGAHFTSRKGRIPIVFPGEGQRGWRKLIGHRGRSPFIFTVGNWIPCTKKLQLSSSGDRYALPFTD